MAPSVLPEEEAVGRTEHEIYSSEFQIEPWDALTEGQREQFRRSGMLRVTAYLAALRDDALLDMAQRMYEETQKLQWSSTHQTGREHWKRYAGLGVAALTLRASRPATDQSDLSSAREGE